LAAACQDPGHKGEGYGDGLFWNYSKQ